MWIYTRLMPPASSMVTFAGYICNLNRKRDLVDYKRIDTISFTVLL